MAFCCCNSVVLRSDNTYFRDQSKTNAIGVCENKFNRIGRNKIWRRWHPFCVFPWQQLSTLWKMRFNIEQFIENEQGMASFYAIDVSKNPKAFYDHNVSGIPNILVFKGNKEIKRIMGVVSYENLKRIVQAFNEDVWNEWPHFKKTYLSWFLSFQE